MYHLGENPLLVQVISISLCVVSIYNHWRFPSSEGGYFILDANNLDSKPQSRRRTIGTIVGTSHLLPTPKKNQFRASLKYAELTE